MIGRISEYNSSMGFGKLVAGSETFYITRHTFTGLGIEPQIGMELEIDLKGIQVIVKKVLAAPKVDKGQKHSSLVPDAPPTRFYNPYNFVRTLSPQKNTFFEKGTPKKHQCYEGLTGEIVCHLTVETPLFIGNGQPETNNGHQRFDFFSINHKPVIPASSLRGMVRNIFETVTDSCYSIIDDKYLWRRMTTRQDSNGLQAARVIKEGQEYFLQVFTVPELPSGYNRQGSMQPAAWIRRYQPRGMDWHKDKVDFKGLNHGEPAWAVIKPEQHPKKPIRCWRVVELYKITAETEARKALEEKYKGKGYKLAEGYINVTGKNIKNKHDERFYFGQIETKPLPPQIRQRYEEMVKQYKKLNAEDIDSTKKQIKDRGIDDYGLVNLHDPDISKFMLEDSNQLKEGDLVYCKLEEDRVRHVVPVYLSRTKYPSKPIDLLNARNFPCNSFESLCPACRVFGWVKGNTHDDSQQTDAQTEEKHPVAYAGNVFFDNAHLVGTEPNIMEEIVLEELSSPKPTTTFFYLKKKAEPNMANFIPKEQGYKKAEHTLRGRKYYRHHPEAKKADYLKKADVPKRKRTIRGALKSGNVFEFTVRFSNLSEEELGALLWSLQLEKEMFHRLGYGKPLGMGSVKIKVKAMMRYDFKKRYGSIKDKGVVDETNSIQHYLDIFQNLYNDGLANAEPFIDLKAILSSPANKYPIHYPRKSSNAEGKSYEWFMDAANYGKDYVALPMASDDKGLPYDIPLPDRFSNNNRNQR
ncbi:TIGR03986 family CRISPR-associated RAMP protein [Desulfosporosinus sp. BICA1-9]|uniref:TIGR03986 family type III CRISPR-associated RAMP protein n=1 Tax=Desulfosporosinus sp. BICA1-9 TaxID=1531958 RepID=UPI00054BF066|nr:TIGR03986 family CRISPR-associated RAMP protein [Desulfosporosinus sp. BICA1-9]KJS47033.1 MAG: hypothetical protein VR66_22020 [Peptococcaceae bacterium BRH_c23]KJS87119.1 MAG: hypothetical protein JL57_14875 [Desulfosporosinus sp. BICA1-9]HBW37361.1 TIGR03986 family CRISPR-associated RAMP protein [Desulfosporosinus sp.]